MDKPDAVVFLDLDGTIFKYGTNDLLEGAQQLIDQIINNNLEIIITTGRGSAAYPHVYSKQATLEALDKYSISYLAILFDCPSQRIIINDRKPNSQYEKAIAHEHIRDTSWTEAEITELIMRIE